MQPYLNELFNGFLKSIPNVVSAVLIFLVSLYLAHWSSRLLKKAMSLRNITSGVTNLLSQALRWTIIACGLITALQRFFDVTAFLAGLGILGFAVGFALQDVMKNFVSGIILLIQQPFTEGDDINVSTFDGKALAINLRTTELRTFDGRIVLVPNADVLSHPIVNYTRGDRRRVELPISVAADSDVDRVRSILLDSAKAVAGYVSDPAPLVVFQTISTSSIEMIAYFWIDTKSTNPAAAKDAALMKIKDAFEVQDLQAPHPIQTIRLHNGS